MIGRPPGGWIDARNADSRRLGKPVGEFVGAKQIVGLYNLALAVNPLGLYGVQPRTLLGRQAAYDPHSAAALFDLAVVSSEPASHLAAYVPASCVVPDQEQELLANRFELFATPIKESDRYPTHGPTIHQPHPRPVELRQIEPVAGDGFRIGIVFGDDRPSEEAQRLSLLGPA